ncbi:3-hydroxyacyl-CoA dehydrogenase [Noviherbaspirillum sedimenti]|uniref:3-hydroxyacyl-CoA dehydrogenase n=1 Tax=Noviherbaspirillum sedimenti TaxID=2320865 RepID=A0A3A3G4P3_9BURK|nr:3-hydroxyacyl-CoA dehydrogenase [Noviherbaspirillum sedimenti]RJG03458.1 3-hydroxyacyl-CoA dehydrogenase [Noviherbaspirillum sedimenti]
MSSAYLDIQSIGIVGGGAMGRGIAQIAILSGHFVYLYDNNAEAVAAADAALRTTLATLVEKGKLDAKASEVALGRLKLCNDLADLRGCELIIEAIIERLDVKQALFGQLEKIVAGDCILASNTSSLSITAIAAACAQPERVVGFHFFNPVPLMKVVEVIDGLRSDSAAGDALMALTRKMGHTPVRARDMPGFIVNHAGRAMNTEGLRIAQEGVATFAEIDAIMRDQAGFRMGPFELMDLTGLDVSQPVMESIYHQFYEEARYRPSPIAAVRLAGGLLGRKSGEGFYLYRDGKKVEPELPMVASTNEGMPSIPVWVSPAHPQGSAALKTLLQRLGVTPQPDASPSKDALILVTPFGSDASSTAAEQGLDPKRVVAVDTLMDLEKASRRTLMSTPATDIAMLAAARAIFGADGVAVSMIRDSCGFVAQRMVAAIVNTACDIAQQQIASTSDIDSAVRFGLGYPHGPLTLGDKVGAAHLLEVLRNMLQGSGDPRYRPSSWLVRRVQTNLSLTIAGNY